MSQDLINVRIDTATPGSNLEVFFPGGEMRVGRCVFSIDPPGNEPYDFWVVWSGLLERTSAICPPRNTLFISGEPPTISRFAGSFLKQFHHVLTCDPAAKHPRNHLSYLGLPWHIGLKFPEGRLAMTHDDLSQQTCPEKTKLISVICSDKTKTRGQVLRLNFTKKLRSHFGNRIDFFGRGFNPVPMKWEAIAPYHYHVVLENSSVPHYWSEKLADAYLGYAYPIYAGCPNIDEYLPADSLTPIDTSRPDEAIALIDQVIAEDRYEASAASRIEARRRILDEYSPFAVMAKWVETIYETHDPIEVQADTEKACTSRLSRVAHKVRRFGSKFASKFAKG